MTVNVPQDDGIVALIGPLGLAVQPPVSLVTEAVRVLAVPDWAVPPDGDTDVIAASARGAVNANATRTNITTNAM